MSGTGDAENDNYSDSDNKNSGISWVLLVMVALHHFIMRKKTPKQNILVKRIMILARNVLIGVPDEKTDMVAEKGICFNKSSTVEILEAVHNHCPATFEYPTHPSLSQPNNSSSIIPQPIVRFTILPIIITFIPHHASSYPSPSVFPFFLIPIKPLFSLHFHHLFCQ